MFLTANIKKIIFLIAFLITLACTTDDPVQNSCVHNSTINVQINLTLAGKQALQQVGGWVYVGGELAGTRGLIVVRTSTGFKAYDRNAPHICPTANSTLEVDDLIILCPEDDAQWILTTGEPIAVANRAPINYFTSINGNLLTIYSN